jgi:hypothetical protein
MTCPIERLPPAAFAFLSTVASFSAVAVRDPKDPTWDKYRFVITARPMPRDRPFPHVG